MIKDICLNRNTQKAGNTMKSQSRSIFKVQSYWSPLQRQSFCHKTRCIKKKKNEQKGRRSRTESSRMSTNTGEKGKKKKHNRKQNSQKPNARNQTKLQKEVTQKAKPSSTIKPGDPKTQRERVDSLSKDGHLSGVGPSTGGAHRYCWTKRRPTCSAYSVILSF